MLLTALLPLAALASSDSLISQDMIRAETANYDTHTVSFTTLEKTNSGSLKEFYPYTYSLRFEKSGAHFVEYLVRRGDEVKKGDVLALFTLETDEAALAGKRLSLQRMEEAFTEGQLTRHKAIQQQEKDLLALSDPYDQAIALLKIQRSEIALEQYIHQQTVNIENLRQEIAQIEEELTQTALISPFDGIVEDVTYKRAGDPISPSETLITLAREDYMLLRASNSDCNFRYGMEVKIQVGRNKNQSILTGRVVGADNLLPESRRTGYAYIQLDPYDEESIRLTSPKLIASTYYLENVMAVPRRAVEMEAGKYYVNQLIDGVPRKRYVNFVMQTTSDAWIIQGLNEGDVIVID